MGPPLKAGTPVTGPERPQSRLVTANYTTSCVQAPQDQTRPSLTRSSFGGQPGKPFEKGSPVHRPGQRARA